MIDSNFVLLGYRYSSESATLTDCYVTLHKSLLGLDYYIKTITWAKRISYLSIVIGAMLIYWWWEAMLITYFSFPLITLPFNNIEELLTKSDKKVKKEVDLLK